MEFAIDSLYDGGGEDKSWISTARMHIVQAIQKCWRKIQFPPAEVWDDWDSVDQTDFHEGRRDVADMLQSSYTLIGSELLSMFASLVLQSLDGSRWAELEASLYCLGTLSDCISDEENDGKLLSSARNKSCITHTICRRFGMEHNSGNHSRLSTFQCPHRPNKLNTYSCETNSCGVHWRICQSL